MKSTIGQLASIIQRSELPVGLILIGPPCSGKSTALAQLGVKASIVVASTDDLIEQYAASQGKTYSEVFREVNFSELKQRMMATVARAKEAGLHIAFDQTNMSQKSRREKVQALRGMYLLAVVLPYEHATLQARNLARSAATGKFIPEHVFKSMLNSYQAPTKAEGFDEIIELI